MINESLNVNGQMEIIKQQRLQPNRTLIEKFSEKIGVEPEKLLTALKATAFKQSGDKPISNEQMLSLIVVAHQHNLNPFTKEIYAFPSNGGIVPIVGVDGWARIINENPNFNGLEFNYSEEEIQPLDGKLCPTWIECRIHRKDRNYPTTVREYLDESFKPSSIPWKTHTKRMLRHKAMIQCARISFSLGGIYEEEEGKEIIINSETNGEKVINNKPIPIENKSKSKAEEILFNLREKINKDKENELINQAIIKEQSKSKEQLDDEFHQN